VVHQAHLQDVLPLDKTLVLFWLKGHEIKDIIEHRLTAAFNKPDFAALDSIFHGDGKCILKGRVEKNERAGKENRKCNNKQRHSYFRPEPLYDPELCR